MENRITADNLACSKAKNMWIFNFIGDMSRLIKFIMTRVNFNWVVKLGFYFNGSSDQSGFRFRQ